jgi:hypothetical protein
VGRTHGGRFFRAALLGAVALATAFPLASRADWLVLRDGSRLETKGGWETRGAMVVFHRPNGAMASLRLTAVDLDASAALTQRLAEEAARPKPVPTPVPRREPVMVLTDEDFTQVETPAAPASDAAGAGEVTIEGAGSEVSAADGEDAPAGDGQPTRDGAAANAAADGATDRLRVLDVRDDLDAVAGGDLAIVGVLHNVSAATALSIGLTVQLFDEEGVMIGEKDALLGAAALQPNQRTNFRVTFPGMSRYARRDFKIRHVALETAAAPQQ